MLPVVEKLKKGVKVKGNKRPKFPGTKQVSHGDAQEIQLKLL